MKYTLEIQKILFQVEDNAALTPKDKVQLLKQAAFIADDNDDIEWAYDIRLQLIRECYYIASSSDLVNEFSWILNTYEEHPDWFDESDFLWQYKWILGEMYNNPDVSLEQINHIMEDFKNRLLRNGYVLRPYYDRLFEESLILGDYDKAKEYLDLANEAPDDQMGSCAACRLDSELDYYLYRGDFEEAYNRSQPLLSKQLSCTHVPARTFCALTYFAQKAGKQELAAELLERAHGEMEKLINDENMVIPASMLINYLLPRDREKAIYYLEKSIPWFMEDDGYSQYEYSCYVFEGLHSLNPAEKLPLHLPANFPVYNQEPVYSVQQLADYFLSEARKWANALDKRNQRTSCNERIDLLVAS